jgi:hypothetical protein
MASEIRVNQIKSRTGIGTVSFTNTGPVISGVTTVQGTLNVTRGINGNLTGNVTGDLTGNLTGNVTGNLQSTASLAGISSSISDTAVDVFVYDTRKDSDGGAWRKRTQHTSWYNETLNTATRGSRREFPAVAVIVIENGSQGTPGLTIYDGDDPDLPMWMIFNETPGQSIWQGTDRSSVAALNGIIVVGQITTIPLPIIGFVADEMYNRRTDTTKYNISNIAIRNTSDAYSVSSYFSQGLVNTVANDVAMTVLPNAPIDDATGLPIPTIAVATNGGVSVIKDDGTVVDAVGTTFDVVNSISFDKNNRIICSSGTGGTDQAFFSTFIIPSSDISHVFPGGDNGYYRDGYGSTDLPWYGSTGSAGNHFINEVSSYGDYISFGTEDDGSTLNPGLKILSENITSPSEGMLCGISTDYNTGWMHGAIKGAFLSDTDATNAVASTNLASGMTFAATARLTSHTYDDGDTSWQMVDNSGDANGYVQIYLNGTTSGKQYLISLDIDSNPALDNGYDFNVYSYSTTSQIATFSHWDGAGAGTLTAIYTSTHQADDSPTQSDVLSLYVNATTANITNFTVREATEADRSVNNNSLAVYGTVTKSAVATGAELVAYSGFSGSNLLYQPYNSGLNPGTGDYSFMCWFKVSATTAEQIYMRRFSNVSVTGGTMMRLVATSSVLQWYVRDTSSTATAVNSTMALDDGVWHCAVGTREGATAKLYIDGELNATSGCSANSNDPGTTANFVIGAEEVVGTPGTFQNPADLSSLTLIRYSLSAPSAAQVKKMYEDEKFLFQENAACTLYGSSDAVTALAYDDSTNLLYAGTSSGRSDFQGLRRINNTTTAVTTAISASNGLVAEQ